MSCRRADTISVEAFLLQPEAAEFNEFRTHSVNCVDCTAFLEDFGDFEEALLDELAVDAGEAEFHPPVEWLSFAIDGRFESEAQQLQTESHLERCAACRSELVAMQTFDVDALRDAVGEPPAEASAPRLEVGTAEASAPGLWEKIKNALTLPGGVGGPVPALAAVLFVLFLAARLITGGGDSAPPQIALEETQPNSQAPVPAPTPEPTPGLSPGDGADDGRELLAESPAPVPTPMPEPIPEPSPAPPRGVPETPSTQLALETPEPKPTPEAPPEVAPPEPAAPQASSNEMLLASLGDLAMPAYAAPNGAGADGFEMFSTMRGAGSGPEISIMAPSDHVGFTSSRAPRLWWSLSEATPLAVTIVVDSEDADEPLLEKTLAGPQVAGLNSIDLDAQGVRLTPGVQYDWYVSLVVDPNRPSKNPVAGGAIRALTESDSRAKKLRAASPLQQGHTAAAQGIWYDAFDRFAGLAAEHPEVEAAARYRDELLRSAR
ncbi:MAG: DUF928 domain-containing protein [Myxococcota bacterium]